MQINTKYEVGNKVWSANVFDKDYVFYGTIVEFETFGSFTTEESCKILYIISIERIFDGRTGEEIVDLYIKKRYLQFSIFEKYIYTCMEDALKALRKFN